MSQLSFEAAFVGEKAEDCVGTPKEASLKGRLKAARQKMTDWRSYDSVVEEYDRLWAPRLSLVARHLLAQAPLIAGDRLLDLGTGSGLVARAAVEELAETPAVIGCDLSVAMLRQARRHLPSLLAVAADAARLPFADSSFDLVTANLVLSHVSDYRRTLQEVGRVLRAGGGLAISNWGPRGDPYEAVWRELLIAKIGEAALEEAGREVVPWEEHLADPKNLGRALEEAGFARVSVSSLSLLFEFAREDYLASRELSSAGRLARHRLRRPAWEAFQREAREHFAHRFGEQLSYSRPLHMAVGVKS